MKAYPAQKACYIREIHPLVIKGIGRTKKSAVCNAPQGQGAPLLLKGGYRAWKRPARREKQAAYSRLFSLYTMGVLNALHLRQPSVRHTCPFSLWLPLPENPNCFLFCGCFPVAVNAMKKTRQKLFCLVFMAALVIRQPVSQYFPSLQCFGHPETGKRKAASAAS